MREYEINVMNNSIGKCWSFMELIECELVSMPLLLLFPSLECHPYSSIYDDDGGGDDDGDDDDDDNGDVDDGNDDDGYDGDVSDITTNNDEDDSARGFICQIFNERPAMLSWKWWPE